MDCWLSFSNDACLVLFFFTSNYEVNYQKNDNRKVKMQGNEKMQWWDLREVTNQSELTCKVLGRNTSRRTPYQRRRLIPGRGTRYPHLQSSVLGWGDPRGPSPACGDSSGRRPGRDRLQPTRRREWVQRDPTKFQFSLNGTLKECISTRKRGEFN